MNCQTTKLHRRRGDEVNVKCCTLGLPHRSSAFLAIFLKSFMKLFPVLIYILVLYQFSVVFAYNILGVFPVRAYSHFSVLNSIALELARRGHNVTVYSRYSATFHTQNYRHIELKDCFPLKNDNSRYNSVEYISDYGGILGFIRFVLTFIPSPEAILSCEPLMKLVNTTDQYDALLLEAYNGNTDIYVGLSYKLNAPYIGVSSTMLYPWLSERMGTPDNPSYIPVPFTGFTSEMNFWQRTANTVAYLVSKLVYNYVSIPRSDAVARRVFGSDMPPLQQLLENCSLIFTYTHPSISPVRPLVPNVVEIAGVNIGEQKKLPENIEKFINESEHGVVYFSMGSFIHSRLFPKEKLEAFLDAFSKIPQRVIWKWEGDPDSINSDKILVGPWMPQKDILAHPKVKLFMSHGGLLGINEAISAGVPILGIPIFADQSTNVNLLRRLGAAEILNYGEISQAVILEKMMKILSNNSYSINAQELSVRYKDRPMSPQDTVTYWTEYVIRHQGAYHLQTAAVHMPFYQYLLLDVIACFLLIFIVLHIVIFFIFKLSFDTISVVWQKIFFVTRKEKTN